MRKAGINILSLSLWLNLLLGIALGATFLASGRISRPAATIRHEKPVPNGSPLPSQPLPLVNPENFLDWSFLEADDYASYIQNLRNVRCPENIIEAIISADLLEQKVPLQETNRVTQLFSVARPEIPPLSASAHNVAVTAVTPEPTSSQLVAPSAYKLPFNDKFNVSGAKTANLPSGRSSLRSNASLPSTQPFVNVETTARPPDTNSESFFPKVFTREQEIYRARWGAWAFASALDEESRQALLKSTGK